MKFIYSLLAALCMGSAAFGQVLAVNPATSGGFESGVSLAVNGWTAVNPATVANQWIVGSSATPIGTACAYISNNALSYAYTITAARTAHFYRDITIPTGSTNINLYFKWKGNGDPGNDFMYVSTAPTSVTPVANAPASPAASITGATTVWTQTTTAPAFTLESIALPSSLAGTTVRLIFTWTNNASAGTNPGAAVDSIAFSYDCPEPSPITGNAPICIGNTITLADASTGGAWSSSDPAVATISSAGVVSGLAQGTTTISYTTVCLAPAMVTVAVHAVPAAISGPTVMCLGGSLTLGETSTGGTWTSSASSVASVDPVTGVVSGVALGTARITYNNGCGLPATKLVTVSTIPPAISSPGYVCEGGATIAISDAIHIGTWTSDNTSIATVTGTGGGMATVTGVTAGIVTISYYPDTTCPTSTVVTVNTLPAPISGIVPLCIGNSAILTNAAGGGLWYSSVPGVASIDPFTGEVTGVTGGTTVISYTNACGTGTSTITIDPTPAAITGYDSACIGGHTTLADVTIGGTWISSNPAVASVVSGAGSGLLTGLADGTTIITYMMPGGCYATREVTVFALPSAISGLTTLCHNATSTLSNAVPGGTWSSSNPALATVGSLSGVVTGGIASGTTADTVGILYTALYGCTAYGVLTINPTPFAIMGDSLLCTNDVDTLTDLSPGGTWSSLTTSRATINATTGIMTAVSGGLATIKYTLPTGCSITKIISINPLPTPVVTFNPAVNTFYATPGFVSYQWYNSLGIVTGATSDHTAGLVNGFYYVTVTDGNGCSGNSAQVPFNVSMSVSYAVTGADVKVYPNPATDMVYIQAPVAVSATVTGIDGRQLLHQEDGSRMDISKLPAGLYILSVYNAEGNLLKMQKLTKQ